MDTYLQLLDCNCEAKLLKLKANYNWSLRPHYHVLIVIARRSYLN